MRLKFQISTGDFSVLQYVYSSKYNHGTQFIKTDSSGFIPTEHSLVLAGKQDPSICIQSGTILLNFILK
jgi:hypothetical protein